ncbi:spinster family MFS transporter [Altericroceibacterium endophyticum]|uniref:MFS transporter n=1 Tax=Altericroceibacterium endophyticum TaxID=1808508 RepID=A0A6I4T5X5_9SPHN|nr:MFS transporter [Altericroceibacterium endophyticum]MXO66594.1 MFS transporter [Altericroceibacterium endophyticum]
MNKNDEEHLLSPSYRRMFIGLVSLVAVFNYADRAIFAALAEQIKIDLNLSDLQLGILQGLAFAFLYALLGLPIGRLAERASRTKILAGAIILWSAMTAACGLIGNFVQLLLCRVGVGMGEAAAQPATASLVGDHFPRDKRASVMSLVLLGSPIGSFLGASVGGWIGGIWGWRAAFIALGIPGVVVGVLVLLVLREPRRGLVDNTPVTRTPPPDFRAFLRAIRRKRALLFVILGGSLAGFGMTSISQFMAVFLIRTYDLPVQYGGTLYGVISGVSLTLGLLIGSFGTDWLAGRGDIRWPAWGAAAGLMIAPFLYWIAFSTTSVALGTGMLILSGACLLLYFGPTQGMIQNMLEPRMRATGVALFSILYTIFGYGLGPTFVGWLSDYYAKISFQGDFAAQCHGPKAAMAASQLLGPDPCAIAAAYGVKSALMSAVGIFFVAALCFLLASRTMDKDYYMPGDEA